jgi:hypothetical protein
MRERTPLTSDIIQRLPNLKLIASTAGRNASIDMSAADFIICMCELISDRHSFSHDDLLNISSDRSQ